MCSMVREERDRKGESIEWRYNSWFQRCAHRRCFFHKGVGNSSWVVVVLVDALGLIRLDKRDIMCALVGQVHHAGGAASAAAGGGGGEGGGHRAPQADHRRHARASGRLMVPSRPFRVPCVMCRVSCAMLLIFVYNRQRYTIRPAWFCVVFRVLVSVVVSMAASVGMQLHSRVLGARGVSLFFFRFPDKLQRARRRSRTLHALSGRVWRVCFPCHELCFFSSRSDDALGVCGLPPRQSTGIQGTLLITLRRNSTGVLL